MIVTGIIVGAVFALVSYISCSALWVSLVIFAITVLFFSLYAERKMKGYRLLYQRFDQCYTFINAFLVSLSIKGSLKGALETTVGAMGDDFGKEFESLREMSDLDKLQYLSRYFSFHVYQLFTELFLLWQDQGGDILDMSHYLLNECYLLKDYLLQAQSMSRKKVVELIVLWAFSLVILVVLRFALSQFYSVLASKLFYQLGVLLIFAFILFSAFVTLKKVTGLDVKGWNGNEQNP